MIINNDRRSVGGGWRGEEVVGKGLFYLVILLHGESRSSMLDYFLFVLASFFFDQ